LDGNNLGQKAETCKMTNPTEKDIGRVAVFDTDPDGHIMVITSAAIKKDIVQVRFLGHEDVSYTNPAHLDWWSKRISGTSFPISGPGSSRTGG
jgi:hypothetical protein